MWKTASLLDPSIFSQLFAFIVVTTKMDGIAEVRRSVPVALPSEFFMGFLAADYVII
jgi:hypothetical protein